MRKRNNDYERASKELPLPHALIRWTGSAFILFYYLFYYCCYFLSPHFYCVGSQVRKVIGLSLIGGPFLSTTTILTGTPTHWGWTWVP